MTADPRLTADPPVTHRKEHIINVHKHKGIYYTTIKLRRRKAGIDPEFSRVKNGPTNATRQSR